MVRSTGQAQPSAVDVVHLEDVGSWLRKHGKPVRPRLDRRQLDALRECFDIIDTDGTGTITTEELQDVFKSLGDHVSLQAVASVLDSVRYHGSNGIGFAEFIDVMSRDSQDLKEGSHNRSNGNATTAYNIALMARAYRRKKVMEAVFKDEGGWRTKFVHMYERIKDRERQVKLRLMSESMMPLTSQMSALVSSGERHRVGPQSLESDVMQGEQLAQSDGSLPTTVSGSIVLPRTRTRMGTGALPIVTQSLLSELPANAESQTSASPGVSPPLPTADPLSAAPQSWAAGPPVETSSAVRAELQDADVSSASDSHAASQTSVISGQGTARLLGTDTQRTIHFAASDGHAASQTPELAVSDSAEDHVWGATRSRTDLGKEQVDEGVTPVRYHEKKEGHVTPRTRHKLQWLQDSAEAVTTVSWQRQQSQPFSVSMQLHPPTDTNCSHLASTHAGLESAMQSHTAQPGSMAASLSAAGRASAEGTDDVCDASSREVADGPHTGVDMSGRHIGFQPDAVEDVEPGGQKTDGAEKNVSSGQALQHSTQDISISSGGQGTARQVDSSNGDPGGAPFQSPFSSATAVEHEGAEQKHTDDMQLGTFTAPRGLTGGHKSVAFAAGGSMDSNMMAAWQDATATSRHLMGLTGQSTKGLLGQCQQVTSELSHTRHVSPRNILRQAAFLGQPQALPPPGWNASISSHSCRHLPEHTAQLMTPTAVEPQLATAASTSATAVDNMPTSISRNTGVVCKAVGLGRVQVPSLSLAAVRAVRHTHGLHASHSKATDGQHRGLSNDTDSQQAAVPSSVREFAHHSLAAQMAQGHHATASHGGDASVDRQQPAGTMSRPRSSVFAKRPMSGQPIHDPDEHPVTYRTQRAPLLPAPQSSRAPWLHTAAVTAVRFKQPSRAQTARLSGEQSLPMQATPMVSGRSTDRTTGLSRRLALQQRVDAKPVAVHQQIRRETQAQVRLLAEQQAAQATLYM